MNELAIISGYAVLTLLAVIALFGGTIKVRIGKDKKP